MPFLEGHALCFRCDGLRAVDVSPRAELVPSPSVVGLA